MLDIMALEWTCQPDPKASDGVKEKVEIYVPPDTDKENAHLLDKIKKAAILLERGIKDRDLDAMMSFHSAYTELIEALKPKEAATASQQTAGVNTGP